MSSTLGTFPTLASEDWMFRMAGLDTGLKLVDPYLDAPDTPLRLLALANVAGFVAAASNNVLYIFSLEQVRDQALAKKGELEDGLVKKVSISSPIVNIAFTSDEKNVIVTTLDSAMSLHSTGFLDSMVSLSPGSPGTSIKDVYPQPKNGKSFAALKSDGSVISIEIGNTTPRVVYNPAEHGQDIATAFSWSSHDDSYVVATQNTGLILFSKDGTLKATIPFPESEEKFEILSIEYFAPDMFQVSTAQDSDNAFIVRPEDGKYAWLKLEASLPFGDDARTPTWYSVIIRNWLQNVPADTKLEPNEQFSQVFITASAQSSDLTIFTENIAPEAVDDSQKAMLPFDSGDDSDDEDDSEPSPVGLALDFTTTAEVQEPYPSADAPASALPIIWILTKKGRLLLWNVSHKRGVIEGSLVLDAVKHDYMTCFYDDKPSAPSRNSSSSEVKENLNAPVSTEQAPSLFSTPAKFNEDESQAEKPPAFGMGTATPAQSSSLFGAPGFGSAGFGQHGFGSSRKEGSATTASPSAFGGSTAFGFASQKSSSPFQATAGATSNPFAALGASSTASSGASVFASFTDDSSSAVDATQQSSIFGEKLPNNNNKPSAFGAFANPGNNNLVSSFPSSARTSFVPSEQPEVSEPSNNSLLDFSSFGDTLDSDNFRDDSKNSDYEDEGSNGLPGSSNSRDSKDDDDDDFEDRVGNDESDSEADFRASRSSGGLSGSKFGRFPQPSPPKSLFSQPPPTKSFFPQPEPPKSLFQSPVGFSGAAGTFPNPFSSSSSGTGSGSLFGNSVGPATGASPSKIPVLSKSPAKSPSKHTSSNGFDSFPALTKNKSLFGLPPPEPQSPQDSKSSEKEEEPKSPEADESGFTSSSPVKISLTAGKEEFESLDHLSEASSYINIGNVTEEEEDVSGEESANKGGMQSSKWGSSEEKAKDEAREIKATAVKDGQKVEDTVGDKEEAHEEDSADNADNTIIKTEDDLEDERDKEPGEPPSPKTPPPPPRVYFDVDVQTEPEPEPEPEPEWSDYFYESEEDEDSFEDEEEEDDDEETESEKTEEIPKLPAVANKDILPIYVSLDGIGDFMPSIDQMSSYEEAEIVGIFNQINYQLRILAVNSKSLGSYILQQQNVPEDEQPHTIDTLGNPEHWTLSEMEDIVHVACTEHDAIKDVTSHQNVDKILANSRIKLSEIRHELFSAGLQIELFYKQSTGTLSKSRGLSPHASELQKKVRLNIQALKKAINTIESDIVTMKSGDGLHKLTLNNLKQRLAGFDRYCREKSARAYHLSKQYSDMKASITANTLGYELDNSLVLSTNTTESSLADEDEYTRPPLTKYQWANRQAAQVAMLSNRFKSVPTSANDATSQSPIFVRYPVTGSRLGALTAGRDDNVDLLAFQAGKQLRSSFSAFLQTRAPAQLQNRGRQELRGKRVM